MSTQQDIIEQSGVKMTSARQAVLNALQQGGTLERVRKGKKPWRWHLDQPGQSRRGVNGKVSEPMVEAGLLVMGKRRTSVTDSDRVTERYDPAWGYPGTLTADGDEAAEAEQHEAARDRYAAGVDDELDEMNTDRPTLGGPHEGEPL